MENCSEVNLIEIYTSALPIEREREKDDFARG